MDDARKAAVQAAALLERLARLTETIGQSNRHAADTFQHTAATAPDLLRQAAHEALRDLTQHTLGAVQQGLLEPQSQWNRCVLDNTHHMQRATHDLTQSQQALTHTVRKLHWLVFSVCAVMSLIAIAGAGLAWHYRSVIAENQIEASLMHAYNQADVSLCGGQLCVRVERADKRWGDYVPVKPRTN